jgi:hypothetical protein
VIALTIAEVLNLTKVHSPINLRRIMPRLAIYLGGEHEE